MSANWRKRAQSQRSGDCSEREKLEDQYRGLLAYHSALDAVHLPSAIPASAEVEQIDGARSASRTAMAILEDHKRWHGCSGV